MYFVIGFLLTLISKRYINRRKLCAFDVGVGGCSWLWFIQGGFIWVCQFIQGWANEMVLTKFRLLINNFMWLADWLIGFSNMGQFFCTILSIFICTMCTLMSFGKRRSKGMTLICFLRKQRCVKLFLPVGKFSPPVQPGNLTSHAQPNQPISESSGLILWT